MARPKKATVDYFPHDCNGLNKQTLFILDQKYGNDGYGFWWKMLEILGKTENHFIDCRNSGTWEFLQAITHLSADKCTEILDLLSSLGAIDKELWDEWIIWSDNFIKGIEEVYKNRRVEIPSRPSSYNGKHTSAGVSTETKDISNDKEEVSTGENPQSKVKETKVKEIKDKYLKFVLLTKDEYQKLLDRFGKECTDKHIKGLDDAIAIHGYQYKDHYRVILKWYGEKADPSTGKSLEERIQIQEGKRKKLGMILTPQGGTKAPQKGTDA